MKRLGIISAVISFLLFGITSLVYAQHEEHGQQQEQAQPAAQQHQQPAAQPHQQPAPPQHQQQAGKPAQHQAKPQPTYGGAYHGGVQPNGPTYGGVHHSGVPQHQGQVHSGFAQSRASSWSNEHRTWGQRGGYNGYRVPEDRFRLYFGRDHGFRIYGLPMLFVGGYPRFQYDGYWVTFVDPWPEMWPDTWYETDDVYLDYTGDGYYLYNRTRPGVGIAVTMAF
jgi:hypothetical protein